MARTKHYFYSAAQYYEPPHMAVLSCVSKDKHPFRAVKEMNDGSNYRYSIISWQEITKEEYDLFMELHIYGTVENNMSWQHEQDQKKIATQQQ
jgi:hypothetical protein